MTNYVSTAVRMPRVLLGARLVLRTAVIPVRAALPRHRGIGKGSAGTLLLNDLVQRKLRFMPRSHHPRVAQLVPKELDGFIASVKRVIATRVDATPACEAFIQRYCSADPFAPVAA